jgi:phosphate starvation-inducible PhoH-like protein
MGMGMGMSMSIKKSHKLVVKQNWSVRHQTFLKALENPIFSLVICEGPSGVGKTTIACDYISRHTEQKLILTRPIVSVAEEDLGFLPGKLSQKMSPWIAPFADIFGGPKKIKQMEETNQLEISPLGTMRGRTFHNSIVLADEMQNATPIQLKMLMTRIGQNTKMIILGDLEQTDLIGPQGLSEFRRLYFDSPSNLRKHIQWITLSSEDIRRSPVVSDVLTIFKKEEK